MEEDCGLSLNAPVEKIALNEIDTLLDTICGSSRKSTCVEIPEHHSEHRRIPIALSLGLAEKLANSIFTPRSFPSTTPRGSSTHREVGALISIGTQSDQSARTKMEDSFTSTADMDFLYVYLIA